MESDGDADKCIYTAEVKFFFIYRDDIHQFY